MNLDQILQTVIESDPETNWSCLTHRRTEQAVYKPDVALRIECDYDADKLVEDFKEEWANRHPDPSATSYSFNIFYGASLIKEIALVEIDGGRARLPLPDHDTKTPELLDFRVAEIFNSLRLHEYMPRAGLSLPAGA